MPTAKPWPMDKYPNGCKDCGRSNVRHLAAGLCGKDYARRHKLKIPLDAPGTFEAIEVGPAAEATDVDPLLSFDPFEEVDPFATSESRPGSSPSPELPPSVATTGGVQDEPEGFAKKLFGRKKKDKVLPPEIKTNERKRPGNEPVGRRKSLADDFEQLLGSIGARLSREDSAGTPVGKHYSLGQYLQWNAPATAEVIEENIKGTYVDAKILQPMAKGKDKIGAIGGVLLPPTIIFAIESNPNLIGTLYPALYMALEASLDSLLPAKKKADARAKKRRDAIAEAFGEEAREGHDPIQSMIQQMFPWANWSNDSVSPPTQEERASNEVA